MTLTLNPKTEASLRELAAQRGQAPEEIVDALIQQEATAQEPGNASPSPASQLSPTAALFAKWAEEDKTDDPEEITRRQRNGDELLTTLQASHLSFRIPVLSDEADE